MACGALTLPFIIGVGLGATGALMDEDCLSK